MSTHFSRRRLNFLFSYLPDSVWHDEQIAFVSTEDGIAECEVPPPGTSADLRLFHEYLNGKYPKPEQQTFDAKTRLWLESPIPISFAQALGLTDELFRHYLSHPMIDEEEMRRQIVTGSVSISMYRSMQLWYLDGHVKDTLLLIAGVDGIGPYADLIFHYRTPFAESHFCNLFCMALTSAKVDNSLAFAL